MTTRLEDLRGGVTTAGDGFYRLAGSAVRRQLLVERPHLYTSVGRLLLELIPFDEYRHIPGAQPPVAEKSHEI